MKWIKFRILLGRVLFYQKKHLLHSFFGLSIMSTVLISFNLLMAFEESNRNKIYQEVTSIGPNYIRIDPDQESQLTMSDAGHLLNQNLNPSVHLVAPIKKTQGQLGVGENNTIVNIIWTSPEYAVIHELDLNKGRFFSSQDMLTTTPVVVLGDTAKKRVNQGVFKKRQLVMVDEHSTYLLGVLDPAKTTSSAHLENTAILPINTIVSPFFQPGKGIERITLDYIEVRALHGEVDEAVNQIKATLISEHGEEDFSISTHDSLSEKLDNSTRWYRILGAAFVLLSFSAAIFFMSALMASFVASRKIEIAIRRVSGLSGSKIKSQFIAESVIFCGITGIFASIASVVLVGLIGEIYIGKVQFDLSLRFYVPIASVFLALGIGAIGSLYPSLKAAQIKIPQTLE